jgi:uncharacterized protein (TIGR02996 family)
VTHNEAFLQHICEHPDDDAPRLIYADWLDENGQPERAEFIRLQLQLAKLAAQDAARALLERRERELLRAHGNKWRRAIRTTATRWPFSRGFVVAHLDLSVDAFVKRAHHDLLSCPTWTAELRGPTESIERLAGSPHLKRLSSLRLWPLKITDPSGQLQPAVVTFLCLSPHTVNLHRLHLYHAQIGDEGVVELAGRLLLARLKELDLCYTGVGDEGVRALAGSPFAAGLESLSLRNNERLTDAGIVALAASPYLAGLSVLDLALNPGLGITAARAIADSPSLGKLSRLLFNPSSKRVAGVLQARFGPKGQL